MRHLRVDLQPVADELNRSVRTRDLAPMLGITLVARGGRLWGLCPIHGEKTASFSIGGPNGEDTWYCHGCGAGGGDALELLRKVDSLSFPDAVRKLAAMSGVPLPDGETPTPTRAAIPRRAPALRQSRRVAVPTRPRREACGATAGG